MAETRKFTTFPEISSETLKVLKKLGFERATPVQEATIPLFAANTDVAVDACTGSGKTLAFVIPVVEKCRKVEDCFKKYQVAGVIVSPTRELAKQIYTVAQPFINSVPGLTSALLVGGTDPAQDVLQFKMQGANIIVGTPGRIDDVMKRCEGLMDFKALEVLVLDEADRLLEMGFQAQLDAIMARLPKQRRTGLFSATQTEAVQALARAGLRNAVRVNVTVAAVTGAEAKGGESAEGGDVQKTPRGLNIQYIVCEADEKLPQLVSFLQRHKQEKVIVYFLTRACVDFYALVLKRLHKETAGLQVRALHGSMKQAQREATLAAFTDLPAGVLLCTDVAARGLDIPDVSWIVQYDPPQDPDSFVHRVGRTARMGRSGSALVLLLPHELPYVEFLKLRKVPLEEGECVADVAGLAPRLRKEAEADREVMETAARAFVSYVRGYKEHRCRFIFRLQELHVGRLATSLGLLRLPRLPDIKRATGIDDFEDSPVDPATVKFKDKAREKQRQQALKKKEKAGEAEAALKARQQQDRERDKKAAIAPGSRLVASKRRKLQEKDELEELEEDYKALKKLKRGKISESQFLIATGVAREEEQEANDMGSDDGDSGEDERDDKAKNSKKSSSQGSKGASKQQKLNTTANALVRVGGALHTALEKKLRRKKRKKHKQH